ncbi:MAG: amidohydrolase [Ignavibacteria bacterium]|nr:amidohydrolase [Ignavibacteria bacterium]
MLKHKEIIKHIEHLRQIKKNYKFYDCHVHPFDIIFKQPEYHRNSFKKGIYSTDDTEFEPPQLSDISLKNGIQESGIKNFDLIYKLIMASGKNKYRHIGPTVFTAHMDMSIIDEVLFLQVAPKKGDIEKEMQMMYEMYANDSRFNLSGCVPNRVENDDIYGYVKNMKSQYAIDALKLHPIITGIDLSAKRGKERVESMLSACHKLKLPLLVHGGTSFLYHNKPEAMFSRIENLETIDWGISNQTVIIAHAASYDCDLTEINEVILPKLKKLLDKYPNLVIDISALGFSALSAVLKKIDIERIIFGSDALYYNQWPAVLKLYHALTEITAHADDDFLKIINANLTHFLFKSNN